MSAQSYPIQPSTPSQISAPPRSRTLLVGALLFASLLSGCSVIENASDSLFGAAGAPREANSAARGSRISSAQNAPLQESRSTVSEARARASTEALTDASPGGDGRISGTNSGLEVTWKIPEIPTEGFVLYYGSSKGDLSHKVRVPSDELDSLTDPKSGSVYRYVIPDVPAEGSLFIAIASYQEGTEGPRSDPWEVGPRS